MSDKKVPKLATKYEKVDPSYQSSSSSSEIPPRVQPTRSAIAQTEEQNLDSIESDYSDTVQSPICLSDESPDSSNVENHSDNPTNINQNISFSPSQTIQNEGIMLNEQQELITGIVTGVLQAMKPSKPKVSPPMLTNTNYTDWSIKMFYAMSLNGLWIDPTKDLERQSTSEKLKKHRCTDVSRESTGYNHLCVCESVKQVLRNSMERNQKVLRAKNRHSISGCAHKNPKH